MGKSNDTMRRRRSETESLRERVPTPQDGKSQAVTTESEASQGPSQTQEKRDRLKNDIESDSYRIDGRLVAEHILKSQFLDQILH